MIRKDTAGAPQSSITAVRDRLLERITPLMRRVVSDKASKANADLDKKIEAVVGRWRFTEKPETYFDIFDGTQLTWEEVDFAGLVHVYSDMYEIPFAKAFDDMFEWLKRHPKAMERYTQGGVSFAENPIVYLSFATPSGCPFTDEEISIYRRARFYQAAHLGCGFAEAVKITSRNRR